MKSFYSLCSKKWFWLKERLVHSHLEDSWNESGGLDQASREDVVRIRDGKLRRVLVHAAKTVPYYVEYFRSRGIRAEDVKLDDFPIMGKADYRGHEGDFISSEFKPSSLWRSRTSGSTGEPFTFYKSSSAFDYTYANLWRGLLRFNIRPGDRRAFIKGVFESATPSRKERLKLWLTGLFNRCIFIDAHFLAVSEKNVERALARILRCKPGYFHGYASTIYQLAQYVESHGIDVSRLHLTAIVTESEKCHDFQREVMERVFKAPVVENYGCVEVGMIAQPAKDGKLCVNEDNVYVEATDEGEAVYTTLNEFGYPLIRFKNGDMIKIGEVHSLLPYRTIAELDGRKTEMIKLPQGGALHGFIPMYPISKHSKWMRAYQIYQPEIDRMVIRIVLIQGCLPDEIRAQMLKEMREIVGEAMRIEFEFPSEIPLSKRGKRLFICSDVKD